jgi:hypothetical protein
MAKVKRVKQVQWKSKPDAHDYPAAANYLSLLVADTDLRAALVAELQGAPVVTYQAKDLLRASQLAALTKDNAHVALDLRKIRKRLPLSPVLLVRGDLAGGFPLQIADGYHRICASHLVDENTPIPCRMIDLPSAALARPAARAVVRKTIPPETVAAAAEPATKASDPVPAASPAVPETPAVAAAAAPKRVVASPVKRATKAPARKSTARPPAKT